MSASEKSAVKSLLTMHRTYAELDEYLEQALREAGYAGVDVQKNPVGTRITVFVTRPGLAIGRRGAGIKDLTERVAAKFALPNPQIAVSEVEFPELNPRIMAARTAQIVSRGTAFRRAATWTMNSIMAAGAAGVEIGVAGKLRSDRSHKEKYRMGVVPKSGESAERVVRHATTDVLLKLGLYGIQVSIALKDAMPPQIEFRDQMEGGDAGSQAGPAPAEQVAPPEAKPEALPEAKPEAEAAKPAVTKPRATKRRSKQAKEAPKEAPEASEASKQAEVVVVVSEAPTEGPKEVQEPIQEEAKEEPKQAPEVSASPAEEPKEEEAAAVEEPKQASEPVSEAPEEKAQEVSDAPSETGEAAQTETPPEQQQEGVTDAPKAEQDVNQVDEESKGTVAEAGEAPKQVEEVEQVAKSENKES